MSESHESHAAHAADEVEAEEALLPDDAEQRIGELLEALRESEERMMEGQPREAEEEAPAESEPESPAVAASSEELIEDFLSDEESDFVDLDAEMLDNSADMLELDERDSAEEMLLDEINAAKPDKFETEEEVAVVLREESPLIGQHAAPLTVPAPARPSDAMPQWLTPTLAVIAVALSGSALWFTLNAPAPETAPAVTTVASGDAQALEGLKVDLAALRERLSVVEGETADGKEAVVVLERVQTIVTRMEQTLLNRPVSIAAAKATPAVVSPAAVVTSPQTIVPQPAPEPELERKAELSAYVPTDEAVAVSFVPATPSVTTPANKVYVKGWAVNLRSYYHKADAERLMQHYQQAGIDAELREVPKGDATWHRVRVMGFGSKKEANAFINGLTEEQGRDTAWPSRYQGYIDG